MENLHTTLFKITPLGGVGEIGSNMTLIESSDQIVVIDIGILFPNEDFFDINYLIPDFNFIDPAKFTDLIITHGHEDHIGALPHLIQKFPEITIWASKFAIKLINIRLKEHPVIAHIKEYTEDKIFTFNGFKVHPVHVNHSIPETMGLLIQSIHNEVSAFYVSDFKVDDITPYEKKFNFDKLIKLSKDSPIRLLMADSTNILSSGKTESEFDLIFDLETIFKENTDRRLLATFFPSNVHRLQTFVHLAVKYNRQICCVGKSMISYMQAASACGILKDYENVFVNPDNSDLSDPSMLILLSGCQGDFFGALKKVTHNEHPKIKVNEKDIFIFSSKTIPGNEKNVARIYNKIAEQKAKLITAHDKLIHASGHANPEDLKLLINAYKPTDYAPIHGESFFIQRHVEFINSEFPQIKTHSILNFHNLILSKSEVCTQKNEGLLPILIQSSGLPIERTKISERRKLATTGIVLISVFKNEFRFSLKGIPESILPKLENEVSFSKKELLQKSEEDISIHFKRLIDTLIGYRPQIITHKF